MHVHVTHVYANYPPEQLYRCTNEAGHDAQQQHVLRRSHAGGTRALLALVRNSSS
jgi:hypothetical protein